MQIEHEGVRLSAAQLKNLARPPEHNSSQGETEQTARRDSQNHMAGATPDQQVRVKITNHEHWPKLLIAVSPDNLTSVRIHANAYVATIRLPDNYFDRFIRPLLQDQFFNRVLRETLGVGLRDLGQLQRRALWLHVPSTGV